MRKLLCTLRVCGRKNYRLQDIQLIKITGASAFGLRASLVARGAPKPRSAPSHVVIATSYFIGCDEFVSLDFSRIAPRRLLSEPGLQGPRRAARPQWPRISKVENTGLEPVTSWLQTRRSPS